MIKPEPEHWPYIGIVAIGIPLMLVLQLIDPFLRWVRAGRLAKMCRLRGRQVKRKDLR